MHTVLFPSYLAEIAAIRTADEVVKLVFGEDLASAIAHVCALDAAVKGCCGD
jgi:hypothetical protein